MAEGLARFYPVIFSPEFLVPCSKKWNSSPRVAPEVTPGPPVSPAPMEVMMVPYKEGMTKTSNC